MRPSYDRIVSLTETAHRLAPAIAAVLRAVAEDGGLTVDEMLARDNHGPVVERRQIAWALAVDLVPGSRDDVVAYLTDRSRTTVVHARQRIRALIETEPHTAAAVDRAREAARRALQALSNPAPATT